MNADQIQLSIVLVFALGLFLWGRWRHDIVAAAALLVCVILGLVPGSEAFSGFGHPAVITVACVLILSHCLQITGAVDWMTRTFLPTKSGPVLSLLALIGLGAFMSSFMNNVGAMALLMPVAIQMARRFEISPGQILMPLSFGTILGGMTTLIGTPPNLIVSGFRQSAKGASFGMFDFTPVGLTVAIVGILFLVLVCRWLVPVRHAAGVDGFESGAYLTECRVPEKSKVVGLTLRKAEQMLDEFGAQIVGLVRSDIRIFAPNPRRKIYARDILVIESEAESLSKLIASLGLELEEAKSSRKQTSEDKKGEVNEDDKAESPKSQPSKKTTTQKKESSTEKPVLEVVPKKDPKRLAEELGNGDSNGDKVLTDDRSAGSEEISLMELTVLPGSPICGLSARDLLLRRRYGLNLLAISRQGRRSLTRLRSITLRQGDLLLIQGIRDSILAFANDNGCVPLADRKLQIHDQKKMVIAMLIMGFAVLGAVSGLLPAAVMFALGVVLAVVTRVLPTRSIYQSVDWSVIVLLAALIPVAKAMETTGAAGLIANGLLNGIAGGNPRVALVIVMIVTMFLSDLMNNAATAAVMCPIAIGIATALGVNEDPLLMAVAIGASCAFLTPIGHQNNTLILGPGGFRFGDYWRLGLLLELVVVIVAVPMILWVWPLN